MKFHRFRKKGMIMPGSSRRVSPANDTKSRLDPVKHATMTVGLVCIVWVGLGALLATDYLLKKRKKFAERHS